MTKCLDGSHRHTATDPIACERCGAQVCQGCGKWELPDLHSLYCEACTAGLTGAASDGHPERTTFDVGALLAHVETHPRVFIPEVCDHFGASVTDVWAVVNEAVERGVLECGSPFFGPPRLSLPKQGL